jgi:hypothetical protein
MQAQQGFHPHNTQFAVPLPVQYGVCMAVCILYFCIRKMNTKTTAAI